MEKVLKVRELEMQEQVDALCYIDSYEIKLYGEGKKRLTGTLKGVDGSIVLKSFEEGIVSFFEENDLIKKVVRIKGTVGEYQKIKDINIKYVDTRVEEGYESYFVKVAPVKELFEEFKTIGQQNLSENYYKVVKILLGDKLELFMNAYAGSKMHDALQGGLLNHTVKMLRLGKTLIANDERLLEYKDILYLGIILHDIGKIYEMDKGVYTKYSYVTHRGIGIEMMCEKKKEIVELIGEEGYYQIIAIIQGHHGEWGEVPRTVLAKIVHLIDMLESQTTGILDKIERNEVQEGVNRTVYVDSMNLVL